MKSNKQRRAEIRNRRLKRAKKLATVNIRKEIERPISSVLADHKELAHNNTYGTLPLFYVDKAFTCKDCGKEEVWTAKQQKWWYEIAKGHIDSIAVRCRSCRKRERERKAEARRIHEEGLAKKAAEKTEMPLSFSLWMFVFHWTLDVRCSMFDVHFSNDRFFL